MDNEESRKRVDFYMHAEDREIIEGLKKKYGCTTSTAIRICIRLFEKAKVTLDSPLPT